MPAQGLGERLPAEAFGLAERLPVRLVLDNIRSGQNVGACFRCADAFRIDGLDLCGITCHPPHRDILKSALGASGHVPWNAHAETLSAVQHLQSRGWKVAAAE
ncbi:MAG: TrmH family RNA methyltransferase, partial [Bacteroidota bacterium]|nr:TrmH family RNA methyltransferase [Bacteroidota bacterium]